LDHIIYYRAMGFVQGRAMVLNIVHVTNYPLSSSVETHP